MVYSKLIGQANATPQSQKARPDQIANNAGGFAFGIDKWEQLKRFLILGTEAGTYYVNARTLTQMNILSVRQCLDEDGLRVLQMVNEVSQEGRAIKNDPAILVLAAAVAYGNDETKRQARSIIHEVCRTGTHILHFAAYANQMRRWGRGLRRAVARWYENQCSIKGVDSLAYQMVKYQSRDGWSHKDLIRKSHVGSTDPKCAALYQWALHGFDREKSESYPVIVSTFEDAKTAAPQTIRAYIHNLNLSREMIPTEKLNDPAVAEALWLNAPMTAMIRNLGNMGKAGLLVPGSAVFSRVITLLRDQDALRKARIHPISILIALKTYASGQGVRGHGAWTPTAQVIDALNDAFYKSFHTIEPVGKNLLIAVDSSGSMGSEVVGTPGFSAAEAAAAMALVFAETEPNYTLRAFDTTSYDWNISPKSRLDDVMRNIPGGGGTDVAAPINWAIDRQRKFDAILILTDSETWSGGNHPFQAMMTYRGMVNIGAKLIVIAATANQISVAAPDDPLSLTVCGFDPTVPDVIRAFLSGV